MINEELAKYKELSPKTINEIKRIQKEVKDLLDNPKESGFNPEELTLYIQNAEFALQSLWGFPCRADYHNRWYLVKYCTCPILDNKELNGIKYSIRTNSCPYHGTDIAKTWDDERFCGDD